MENKEVKNFDFAIARILDCGFLVEEAIPAENGKVNLGYGMKLFVDLNENWIQFILKAEFKNIDHKLPMVHSTVLTKFAIKELNSFLNNENKFDFPSGSIETLFGVAFGHLRAITSKNLAGSRHNLLLLPAINPMELFKTVLSDNINLMESIPEEYALEEMNALNMFYKPETPSLLVDPNL